MDSTEIRERRRTLRYRSLLVRQLVQLKTRVASLLMETGVSYDRQRLHRLGFIPELLASKDALDPSVRALLRVSHNSILRLRGIESALIRSLQRDPLLAKRVQRLQTIPAVGKITALTWALEMGDISRFRSIRQAISYCGLCGDEQKSADKTVRTRLVLREQDPLPRGTVASCRSGSGEVRALASAPGRLVFFP
jgi:transposase